MMQRLVALARRAPPDADLVLLTLLCLPALWPLFSPGYPATHDGLFHLYRLVELDRLWKAGELYPRLAPDLALGYDYPVFNYYAPLALFAGELPRMLGLSATGAVKAVFGLSIVGAAWSMRLFLNDRRPRAGALVGALAYSYLPYLLLDVYVRGALAEALAMAVLPLALWGADRLARQPGVATVTRAGLSLAGLILTHSVTAMLALPLLGAYWLLVAVTEPRDRVGKRALAASAALALGLGLSAFYWVPALGELRFISTERAATGFFDFHQHLQTLGHLLELSLVYTYHVDFSLLFRIGLVQVALAVGGLAAALASAPARRREGIFWGAVVLAGLALTWTRSAFVWEHVPLLAYAQFPWRWLAIVGLGSSALTSYLASGIPWPGLLSTPGRMTPKAAHSYGPTGAIWCGCLGAIIIASAVADVRPDRLDLRPDEARPATEQQLERAVNSIAGSPGEYLPRGANPAIGVEPTSGAPAGDVRFNVREAGPFAVDLDVRADRPRPVTLDRFYFPGWQATLDGRSAPPYASGPQGLLTVDMPAGEHRLQVWFGTTTLRQAAGAVSLAALLALLAPGVLVAARDRRNRPRRAPEGPRSPPPAAAPASSWPGLLGVGTGAFFALVLAIVGLGLVGGVFQPRAASASLVGTADFSPGVRLAGSTVTGTDAGRLALTLYWQALRPADQDYEIQLRLIDASGRVVGERLKPPDFGLRPARFWPARQLIRDDQEISLQPGVPAGRYQLLVALVGEGGPVGVLPEGKTSVSLGTVWVPASSLPAASGPGPLATFADRVAVDRVQLRSLDAAGHEHAPDASSPSDLVARPGDRLEVDVRWRDLRDLADNETAFVHLVDRQGRLLSQQDTWPRQRFYPTILWRPGEVVPDRYELRVPDDAPLGRYDLELGLYRLADLKRLPITSGPVPADELRLGSVTVRPATVAALGSISHRLPSPADLGGEVRLLGFDLSAAGVPPSSAGPPTLQAGDHVAIVLYWQASRAPRQDYTVFLHLLDAAGKLVAQTDGEPRTGDYPTSAWGAEDVVADPHRLDLPGDLQPGTYRLVTGMYLLQTGARLALPSGEDQVVLQDLVVRPPVDAASAAYSSTSVAQVRRISPLR